MSNRPVASIILAAGKGTRMKSATHKVLHPIGNRPMLLMLMDTLKSLNVEKDVLVVGADRDQVMAAAEGAEFAVQDPQEGTGHAVMCASDAMKGFAGDTLILYGDVPLISAETLAEMIALRQSAGGPSTVVLGFEAADPGAYGRLVTNGDTLEKIVEFKDANDEEKAITLCNSGIMCVDNEKLFAYLDKVTNDNAQGEYYLTDIVAIARGEGDDVSVVRTDESEVTGINSRGELAGAEFIFQSRARAEAMAGGASLIDPESVFFSFDTKLGKDVIIEPNVVFGPGVTVGDNVNIYGFSHIEGANIKGGAKIGPFARLRPGADVGVGSKVGNFVEMKKSTLGDGAKANHFTYLGDATVGAKANIGAGTITCNYDGFNKSQTIIGEGAFIGSNSSLVAPVKIGDGAIVGAGSVITGDVSDDALGVTRAKQREIEGWAATFRAKQKKK